MRILFVCHRIPYPPNKGDKLRAFNIIKYLSTKKHDIYLVCLYDDREDKKYFLNLERLCKEVFVFYLNPFWAKLQSFFCLFFNKPASLGYFYSSRMKVKVNELIKSQKFDLLFAYSSTMAQYIINADGKKIIDFVDCDSAKWKQYSSITKFPLSRLYNREYKLLMKYESEIVQKFEHLLVVSNSEKQEFAKFIEIAKFAILINGVDTDFFKPQGEGVSKQNKLIFTGAMDYFVNTDGVILFCKKVLPLIKKEIPNVEFYIVGSRPLHSIRKLSRIKRVFVTGETEDVRKYLSNATVSVVPSFRIAQGLQNKILEAMACGIPVVTTSKAISGWKLNSEKDILVADTTEEFAEKVVILLKDFELRKRLGVDARKYIEENHNWEKNLSKLDEIL